MYVVSDTIIELTFKPSSRGYEVNGDWYIYGLQPNTVSFTTKVSEDEIVSAFAVKEEKFKKNIATKTM